MEEKRKYVVLLHEGIGAEIKENKAGETVFDTARRLNECEWIEIKTILDPEMVKGTTEKYEIPIDHKKYILLLDEEGKLKEGNAVNLLASYLYGTPLCGDAIVGNASIVKEGDEDVELLTKDEAEKITAALNDKRMQAHACASVLYAIVASGQMIESPNMDFFKF